MKVEWSDGAGTGADEALVAGSGRLVVAGGRDGEKFLQRFEGQGGEERLLEHLKLLYSNSFIASIRRELADLREKGMAQEANGLLDRFRKCFCNLEIFVKELKERFSRWFNKHHGRKGTLWMDRYTSVIVEDGEALRTITAFIDLNPVRADSKRARRGAVPGAGPGAGFVGGEANDERPDGCRVVSRLEGVPENKHKPFHLRRRTCR